MGWHLLILLTHFYTPEGSQPYPRSDSLYEELNHRWVGVPVHYYGWYASIVVAAIGAALGAIPVRGGTNPGLPFYPWAVRERNHGSVAQDVDIAGGNNVRVLVAVFDTPDPPATVTDFYKQKLGNEVTKFVEKDQNGKTVFGIRKRGLEKFVVLERQDDGTRIELVRVQNGEAETHFLGQT